MGLYPVLLQMENRLAAVIGGGEVAFRKVRDLLEAGARVRVISPELHEGLLELNKDEDERLDLQRREYRPGDLEGVQIAFSATNDSAVNRQVFEEATERGIFLNSVDDPPNCSFIVPSFVRKGELILALSTGGASPAMAARLRRQLERCLPDNVAEILDALRGARSLLIEEKQFQNLNSPERGRILKTIVEDDQKIEGLLAAWRKGTMAPFLRSLM